MDSRRLLKHAKGWAGGCRPRREPRAQDSSHSTPTLPRNLLSSTLELACGLDLHALLTSQLEVACLSRSSGPGAAAST